MLFVTFIVWALLWTIVDAADGDENAKGCLGALVKIILWVVVIGWVISWFV